MPFDPSIGAYVDVSGTPLLTGDRTQLYQASGGISGISQDQSYENSVAAANEGPSVFPAQATSMSDVRGAQRSITALAVVGGTAVAKSAVISTVMHSALGKLAAAGISVVAAQKLIGEVEKKTGYDIPMLGLSAEEISAFRRGGIGKKRAKQGLFNKRALKTLKKAHRYKKQYRKYAKTVGLKVTSGSSKRCPPKRSVC